MIEAIRHQMMTLFQERRQSENDADLIVSNVAKRIQLAKVNLACHYRYLASSNTLYEVLSMRTNTQYVVDFEKRTCSCRAWQELGIPCHHAIAVMIGRNRDPEHYVHRFFTLAVFRATYSGTIAPPETGDFTKPLDTNENRNI
jgi:zinc finger SWIM domain-containing protein 3